MFGLPSHFSLAPTGIFVTLSQALTWRKDLRFSVTENCVMRYGSKLRKFNLSASVASLPIVQWKPPPFRLVEAVVLRSVHDLRFPGSLAAAPPLFFSLSSTKILVPWFVRTPQAMTFLRLYIKRCLLQRLRGQRNSDFQRVMQNTPPPPTAYADT